MARPARPHKPVPVRPGPAPDAVRGVLVVGTDDWAVEQAVARLAEAGHPVLTCHPLGDPAFPCNAMVDGRTCPLDVGFEAVVSIRARHTDSPSFGEMGAVCGLRAGATLVLAGMTRRSPFGPWASVVVEGGDLVASVDQALASRTPVADVRPAALIELDEVAIAPVPAGDVAPAPAV
jgi:hypothetical protein